MVAYPVVQGKVPSFRGASKASEPGISRFPGAQLRTWGLVLRTIREWRAQRIHLPRV